MPAPNNRKTLEELMLNTEPEINPSHVGDWHYCTIGYPFMRILSILPEHMRGNFNFVAAQTAPASIKYRQRDCDFEGGKRGDYLFVDRNGGRLALPFKIFKLLFP